MPYIPFKSSQCPLSDSMHNVAKWSLFSQIELFRVYVIELAKRKVGKHTFA